MSWIALLLVGVGVADLVQSVKPVRTLPECVGAIVAVLAGLWAGLTAPADVAALVVIAAVVVLWGQTVTSAFAGRRSAALPLTVLGLALTLGVLASSLAGPAAGFFGAWVQGVPLSVISDLGPERALLLLGIMLVQLSTGNVVVRLVLTVTRTVNPARHGGAGDPETQLKGGRLLGPMERVVIVGLGVAGQLTAASIVIAAKGLLRFPELSSDRGQKQIHQLTEYFLVGSFVSWLVALSGLVLVTP
jgi:hypothetical protein